MKMKLCDKLKNHRKNIKGYSLDKLAEISGCSKSYIWELENRKEIKPSAEKLSAIAKALDITTEYLLDESRVDFDKNEQIQAFFRNFENLEEQDQEKLIEIAEMWSKRKK